MRSLARILLASIVFVSIAASAQRSTIPFLESRPVIDGIPDPAVLRSTTPIRLLPLPSPPSGDHIPEVRLRMAYGTEFFYVLFEVEADSIVYRDRSYQNGDGFHMTIARPRRDGSPADEFYVLRFSPGNPAASSVASRAASAAAKEARIGVWYYNIDLQGSRLGAASQLQTSVSNGRVYYEAAIAWTDVHPYHPFREALGVNFCFVKAIGGMGKQNYFLVPDEHMQQEGQHRRCTVPIFASPRTVAARHSFLWLTRTTLSAGEADTAVVRVLSPGRERLPVVLHLKSTRGDTSIVFSSGTAERFTAGMNERRLVIPSALMQGGTYRLACTIGSDTTNAARLCVMPQIRLDSLRRVTAAQAKISEGTRRTLLFSIDEAERRAAGTKPYEYASALRDELERIGAMVGDVAARGADVLASKTGVIRRAFLSGVDSTLRPYSVKVPASYDPARRYPLFVYLHGSGEDDREALTHTELTNGEWIECAPNGRGVSNCFTADHAQEDIDEAIADCMKNYPIDTSRIVIAGFSMGGYGAYRTFYAHPEKFCGVAVFSGHPNLASRWVGPGHPDFLDSAYLPSFKNIPMFIYHNENDRNCPYELTQSVIAKLRAAGALLRVVTTKEGGHTIIDDESKKQYLLWLSAFH